MAESSTITREMIEAGARALYLKDRGVPDDAWGRDLPESTMELWRGYARAALTASTAAMFDAKRQPYHSGACIGIDGMSVNLRFSDNSAEFVFGEEDLELINEEGRDLYLARLPASEILALRQSLIDYLPASEAEIRPMKVMPALDAVAVPAPGSEERHFWLEAAEQHDFGLGDDGIYTATSLNVLTLMAAAREQGRKDVLDALATEADPVVGGTEAARDVIAENAGCRRPAVACGAGGTGTGGCGCLITAETVLRQVSPATEVARG